MAVRLLDAVCRPGRPVVRLHDHAGERRYRRWMVRYGFWSRTTAGKAFYRAWAQQIAGPGGILDTALTEAAHRVLASRMQPPIGEA